MVEGSGSYETEFGMTTASTPSSSPATACASSWRVTTSGAARVSATAEQASRRRLLVTSRGFVRAGHPLAYFLMEAVDQPWKSANEGRVGAYWGILHADRSPKFALAGPIEIDARWLDKAAAASLLDALDAARP